VLSLHKLTIWSLEEFVAAVAVGVGIEKCLENNAPSREAQLLPGVQHSSLPTLLEGLADE
jgi:hypothetical protein